MAQASLYNLTTRTGPFASPLVAVMAEVPKKPVCGSFGIYFNENRVEMTKEAIGLGDTFRGAQLKVAMSRWKAMSEAEKQPYRDKYLAKEKEYKNAINEGIAHRPSWPRQNITKAMIVKHGKTKGCRGCFDAGKNHREPCRVRFEKIWDQEAKDDMEHVKIEKDNPLPGCVKEWADFCEKLGAARQMQTLAKIGGFFRSPKMAAKIRIELHLRQKRQKVKLSQQRYRKTMKGKEARRRSKTKSKMKKLGSILRMAVNHSHVIADAEVDAAMSSASVGGGASNSAGPVEKPNRSINNATCADMFADVSLPVMADGAAAAAASGDDDNDVERLEMASGMKFFVV